MSRVKKKRAAEESRQTSGNRRQEDASSVASEAPRSYVRVGILVVVLVGAIVGGVVWMQERELAKVEKELDAGRHKLARFFVDEYLADHPSDPKAMALLARTMVAAREDPQQVIEIFERVSAANTKDLHAWAEAHLMLQHWSHAQPLLRRVVELEPKNADALHELTVCQIRLGDLDDALQVAERFRETEGNAAKGHLFEASIHSKRRSYPRAAESFEKVLEQEPDALNLQTTPNEIFTQYGRVLMMCGKPAEARKQFERSIANLPTPDAYIFLGDAIAQSGNTELARKAWSSALVLDPKNEMVRRSLANAELASNKPKEAYEWLAPLEHLEAMESKTAYIFERIYRAQGNEEESKTWKERTAELRKKEDFSFLVESALLDTPNSLQANLIRARNFAEKENWKQSEAILVSVSRQDFTDSSLQKYESFVRAMSQAVARRSVKELPPLEDLPLKKASP